jgi:hypothetical protein
MMTTTLAYRDDAEGAAIRHADLVSRRARDDRALGDARRAHGRRVARIAAGVTGVAGAAVLAGTTAASHLAHAHVTKGTLSAILLGAWPIMGLAYIAGRVDWWRRAGEPTRAAARARDLHAEIARLEQEVPVAPMRERARRLERASVTLPLAALALLGPLTLHAAVFEVCWGDPISQFDTWIALSLAIVGHAHLVLVWMCHRFAKKVERSTSGEIRATWFMDSWRASGYTIIASAIPGIVLALLPPILTAVTAFCIVPAAFRKVANAIATERCLLGSEDELF